MREACFGGTLIQMPSYPGPHLSEPSWQSPAPEKGGELCFGQQVNGGVEGWESREAHLDVGLSVGRRDGIWKLVLVVKRRPIHGPPRLSDDRPAAVHSTRSTHGGELAGLASEASKMSTNGAKTRQQGWAKHAG